MSNDQRFVLPAWVFLGCALFGGALQAAHHNWWAVFWAAMSAFWCALAMMCHAMFRMARR